MSLMLRQKTDRVTNELIKNGIGIREPSAIIRIKGVEFSMLSLDDGQGVLYDQYIERVGEKRRELVTKLVKTNAYSKMGAGPESDRFIAINSALSKAKKQGLMQFLKEDLKALIDDNPALETPLSFILGSDVRQFIKYATTEQFIPEIQEKLDVRGTSDKGELPLPPHETMRSKSTIKRPRF